LRPVRYPAPGRITVQADLYQYLQGTLPDRGGPPQRLRQPDTVHRVDQVRVPDHGTRLVALQPPDEVPAHAHPTGGHFGHLGRRLLVAVLPDVTDAQPR